MAAETSAMAIDAPEENDKIDESLYSRQLYAHPKFGSTRDRELTNLFTATFLVMKVRRSSSRSEKAPRLVAAATRSIEFLSAASPALAPPRRPGKRAFGRRIGLLA
ncbi:hypothetical protein P7C70_g148, partial [Phenoliferia sp. Uapishka_3]